jgi:hypothetical protein
VYNLDIDSEEDAAPAPKKSKPAILMTGATHARELISTT